MVDYRAFGADLTGCLRLAFARPTLPTISFCGLGGLVSERRSASVARRSVSSSLYWSLSFFARIEAFYGKEHKAQDA
jgi:hypothetical protein